MENVMPYVYGGLGGVGVLLAYYGFRRATDKERDPDARKIGLWMLNSGMVVIGATMALALWLK